MADLLVTAVWHSGCLSTEEKGKTEDSDLVLICFPDQCLGGRQ
ncbi:MAG: hypothetical protein ACLRW2_08535 [Parasutterella excrementihominis]